MRAKSGGLGSGIEYIPTQMAADDSNPGNGSTPANFTVEADPPSAAPLTKRSGADGPFVFVSYEASNIAYVKECGDNGATLGTPKQITFSSNTMPGSNLAVVLDSDGDYYGSRTLTISLTNQANPGTLQITTTGAGGLESIQIDVASLQQFQRREIKLRKTIK